MSKNLNSFSVNWGELKACYEANCTACNEMNNFIAISILSALILNWKSLYLKNIEHKLNEMKC